MQIGFCDIIYIKQGLSRLGTVSDRFAVVIGDESGADRSRLVLVTAGSSPGSESGASDDMVDLACIQVNGSVKYLSVDLDNLLLFDLLTNGLDGAILGRVDPPLMEKVFRALAGSAAHGVFNSRYAPENSLFRPGKDPVQYAGRVFSGAEIAGAVEASLDFYLTEGRFSESFAGKIADFLQVENVLLTNSGSSANLLAISALTSAKLGERRLKPGDEVITVAAGFPSTVSPILQNHLVPVFVDVDIPTYNIDISRLEAALSPKTRCLFLAHTLGNPFRIKEISDFAVRNNLWFIEDNCDAFGSLYDGRFTGTFGHISTISFYPAHHITTGEGGAVITNDELLAQIIRSFRDWGRDCYCAGGENNTCGKRFTHQYGELPRGYDHKYVYTEVGYNLKMTDIQAAIGSVQMDKLAGFCEVRRRNFNSLYQVFDDYKQFFLLPEATPSSDPAWFSFIVTLRNDSPFTRDELTTFFSSRLIETRNLFAGNITRQPGYMNKDFRISGTLENTDYIMKNTFFLGTYPGLTLQKIEYIRLSLKEFISMRLS